MIIRNATSNDIDAIMELNQQIGQYHFDNVPNVFVPPSSQDKPFLLSAILDEHRFFGVVNASLKLTHLSTLSPK